MEFVPSADLQDDVIKHLEFLERIENVRGLHDDSVIENAIQRYVTLWLPFVVGYSGYNPVAPPLDIHWVWYCHALSPLQFRKDIQKLVGKNVHHVWMFPRERLRAQEIARLHWNDKLKGEIFHVVDEEGEDMAVQSPSINVKESSIAKYLAERLRITLSKNQHFYYQVSLPHFRDEDFIQKSIRHYVQFMEFRKTHTDINVVPPAEVELIWRTHILSTEKYMLDCTAWFGQVLNHSCLPATNADHDPSSPRPMLWTAGGVSEEVVVLPGMWSRGESPTGRLSEFGDKEKFAVSAKPCQISIEEIYLDCPDSRKTSKTLTTSVELTGLGEHLSNSRCLAEFQGCHYDPKVKRSIDFTLDPLRYGGITFQLTKKSGSFLKGQKTVTEIHKLDMVPMIETCPEEGTTFSETGQVSFNSVHLTVSARGTITPTGRGPIHLSFIPCSGETILVSKSKGVQRTLHGTGVLNKIQGKKREIHVSKYRFINRASRLVLSCTLLQKLPSVFLVQLNSQDSTVAEGQLIREDCLPRPGEVAEGIPYLDEGGVGFLVKNCHGDWGILTTNKRRFRNKNADKVAVGSIEMKLYTIAPVSKGWAVARFQFPDQSGNFRVELNGCTIDLKDGTISLLNSCADVAEFVALAYGVASLFALSWDQDKSCATAASSNTMAWMKVASGKRWLCAIKL